MNSQAPDGGAEPLLPADAESTEPESQAVEIDPARMQFLMQQLETEQSLPLGIVGGVVAAIAGAAVWAGITYATKFQIGFMAVGVGFLVGFAVRMLGKGVTTPFGIAGAALSLIGCALGNLLVIVAVAAHEFEVPFLEVLSQLDPSVVPKLMAMSFSPLDAIFYGLAGFYGFRTSFRRFTKKELERLLSGGASPTSVSTT